MKKLKINKKIITIATYTIAILSAINFAIYPKTNAIFKKNNEEALAYTSNLEKTYQGTIKPTLNEKESTLNVARIHLILPRDDRYIREGEKYIIEAVSSTPLNTETPNTTCSIVPSTKSGNLIISTDEDNNDIITFTNNENGVIEIECNVEANKLHNENIAVLIKFYEKVLEEDRFLFKEGTFSKNYSEYAEQFKEPSIDSVILIKDDKGNIRPSKDIYIDFIGLITKHAESSDYYKNYIKSIDMFKKYINDNGITESTAKSVLLDATDFELLGVTRTPAKNEDGSLKGYGFEFDENFIGYVKNHNFYTRDYENGGNFVFFSSEKTAQREVALNNTINKWIFNDSKNNHVIGEKNYNDKELVIKYISEYIKNNNLDYTVDNLIKVPGLYQGKEPDTNYPYIGLRPTIIDYAYNYLAKPEGKIRVSYYDNLSESSQISYMKGIPKSAITNMYGAKDPYFSYILSTELDTSTSDFYNAVMCKTADCSDHTEIYYNNNNKKYYQVKVTHHISDKYNEITIKEFDSLENSLKGIYADNIVNSFIANTKFNEAITCHTGSCNTFNELYYDAANNNYILAKVTPNNTYFLNKITITENKQLANVAQGILADNVIAGISANNIEESLLNKAITCSENCDIYSEVHYDTKNDKYYKVNVSPDSNKLNKMEVTTETSLLSYIGSTYNEKVLESVTVSLNDNIYGHLSEALIDDSDYYEVHYDGTNYLLLKVTTVNIGKDSKINYSYITISKLKTGNDTTIDNTAISLMNNATSVNIYVKNDGTQDVIDIENTLVKYLVNILNFDIDLYEKNTVNNHDLIYSSGYIAK